MIRFFVCFCTALKNERKFCLEHVDFQFDVVRWWDFLSQVILLTLASKLFFHFAHKSHCNLFPSACRLHIIPYVCFFEFCIFFILANRFEVLVSNANYGVGEHFL